LAREGKRVHIFQKRGGPRKSSFGGGGRMDEGEKPWRRELLPPKRVPDVGSTHFEK